MYLFYVLACKDQLDVTLVLDYSGSVHHVYDIILLFAKKAAESFNVEGDNDRVGVITYSTRSDIQIRLDQFRGKKKDLINAITGTI